MWESKEKNGNDKNNSIRLSLFPARVIKVSDGQPIGEPLMLFFISKDGLSGAETYL